VSIRLAEVDGQRSWQCIIRDITERRRAEAEVSRANRALRVLSACNQSLVRAESESQLLNEICGIVTGTGGYPLAWIGFARDDAQRAVRSVASSGQARTYLDGMTVTWSDEAHGRGPTGTCIRTGAIAICDDTRTNADFGPWRESADRFGFRSTIALPLRCGGAVIGALTIYAAEPDAFQAEERRLIEELAGDLAFGIEVRRRELERARAEAALRQSELEFRTVFEATSDAIVISDLEGHILEVNEVACRRLGYGREQLLGMNANQIDGSPQDGRVVDRSVYQLLEGQVFEAVSRRKDGSLVPVEVNAHGFEFKGAPAILGVARDITERKRAEAETALRAAELDHARSDAVAANRAKSDFLTHVSHEMRTPLNAVIGMTGLLLDTGLTGERREHAETVRDCAEDLLKMINSILDLSGIEAGRMPLECSGFDLVECIKEIGEMAASQAAAKGLSYSFGGEAGPRWVFGDSGRLRQIVLSLVDNAVKFTERGSVEMRLACEEPDSPGAVWRISVKDTGIGIPQEKLPLLFGKFTQVDSSLVRKYEGAGLGLVISQELAMLMGGAITVATRPGQGSDFTLSVPLAPCAPGAAEHAGAGDAAAAQPTLRPRARRVLLAEDNAVNLKLGVRLLEKLGCRVDAAGNGREAVEMAERFPYDLIFMDCRMPEMDGYEASRKIRSRAPAGPRVPIVALTAHAVKGAREECLQAGMDDYVTKPVRPADLERMLVRWSA
jgi:PAS domain S-box-containing protein